AAARSGGGGGEGDGVGAGMGRGPGRAGEGGPAPRLRSRRIGARRDAVSGSPASARMRLLLLSNSTEHGQGYLDHAMPAIRELIGPARSLAFVPFALHDHDAYTAKVQARFAREGVAVTALGADAREGARVDGAEAVFVGGGNTFRLLDTLQRTGLLAALRRKARSGAPYLGECAGTNVAAPTIKTTNDMPIVQPASFGALGLVPFQINPHYLDADPASRHMGETREDRLREV